MELTKEVVSRYSRQLILQGFGVWGQKRLGQASAVVVGAGGLGCPAALYLASAGLGRLGIVDFDSVELHNLHRQILHSEHRVGSSKTRSAIWALGQINSGCRYDEINRRIDQTNIVEILESYDVVIDATDNISTRYLLNDAAVFLGKPLVSGSALRWEGQLTTYNYHNGPCYRCITPTRPATSQTQDCNQAGILGPVTGTIGSLMALETINLILGQPAYSGTMVYFDGSRGFFKQFRLRSKQSGCVCHEKKHPRSVDYEYFSTCSETILDPKYRISAHEFKQFVDRGQECVVVDVRNPDEYSLCSLANSINIPLHELGSRHGEIPSTSRVFVVCRLGQRSQQAVLKLLELGYAAKDIEGGLLAYSSIDSEFLVY